jgi:hypothetical protein
MLNHSAKGYVFRGQGQLRELQNLFDVWLMIVNTAISLGPQEFLY